jgi:hypothetical protein
MNRARHRRTVGIVAVLNRIIPWIVGAIVLTIAFAAIYVVAQQLDRQGADEAPARLASQVAAQLDDGVLAEVDDADRVDLERSLAPFYVVYGESGSPESGSGYLDGELAQVPAGVIETAVQKESNGVSWEPRPGLRFATIEVVADGKVVLAGQSLVPSESRTEQFGILLLLGWVVGLAILAAGAFIHLTVNSFS